MPTAHCPLCAQCPAAAPARRFHDVEPQPGLEVLPPHKLSRRVLAGGSSAVPTPWLKENTLVVSQTACVVQRGARSYLVVRWGGRWAVTAQ